MQTGIKWRLHNGEYQWLGNGGGLQPKSSSAQPAQSFTYSPLQKMATDTPENPEQAEEISVPEARITIYCSGNLRPFSPGVVYHRSDTVLMFWHQSSMLTTTGGLPPTARLHHPNAHIPCTVLRVHIHHQKMPRMAREHTSRARARNLQYWFLPSLLFLINRSG